MDGKHIRVRLALAGMGNVGLNLLSILERKKDSLLHSYGLQFVVVAVADSSGVAVDPDGFDALGLMRLKRNGLSVNQLDGFRSGEEMASILSELSCDLVVDAAPVSLETGEPGLSLVRASLGHGIDTVLADKGPLVMAYRELCDLARDNRAALAFSATVCGPLPVINVCRRDLVGAEISLFQGVLNATTNFILAELERGRSYSQALQKAMEVGAAEADPRLDVEGWDSANKLVIIANSILGVTVTLDDVVVQGIAEITADQLQHHCKRGESLKLLASATQQGEGYRLEVGPVALPADHFLASCNGWEMGVAIESDLYGPMYFKTWEREPGPTAAAVLRDAIHMKWK